MPYLSGSCDRKNPQYNIRILSDMEFGHLVFEGNSYTQGPEIKLETLVVGGGIAGLAAAYSLRDQDFILCELSNQLGGTSNAIEINGSYFAQGAHYDLAYPDNYGKEGLELLQKLNVIQFNSFSELWEFNDKQFLINNESKSRCFDQGIFREDVLPDGYIKLDFINLLEKFKGEMTMPSRMIKSQYRIFNYITFTEYLKKEINPDQHFLRAVDYQMRDDYGGTAEQVSALAGIHYYQCRPYYTKPVELFSPPQGNYYFVQKLIQHIPDEKIKIGQLVFNIEKISDGFHVKILDRNYKRILHYFVKNIIYAGNKHALKYTFPVDYPLFEHINYAPWAVMNIVLKDQLSGEPIWQNEILSGHPSMIGFVDSAAQNTDSDTPRVLTVYFCMQPELRQILADMEKNKQAFCDQAINLLNNYFGVELEYQIEEVYIRLLGHAMPVPTTGYLFKDQNDNRSYENLVYAGIDNHRLPLFFEALDSGIQAAKMILSS